MKPRFQIQFRFWLNANDDDEASLIDEIHHLKKHRQFAKAIRDGLRLYLDLSRGQTEVLAELFPWVLENRSDNSMDAIIEELKRIQALAAQLPSQPTITRTTGTGKPPTDAELMAGLEIKRATNGKENPTFNFLISMCGVGAKLDELDSEIIEYGIERGKINKKIGTAILEKRGHISKKEPQKPPTENIDKTLTNGKIKKIEGSDINLSVPNFDDDFLSGIEI